ncbi:MAG: hypothetical protein PHW87_00250 [Methanothrix sp.]|jgi:hypothetical protein|nr:hypothetical protein [Methanothrix sp.]
MSSSAAPVKLEHMQRPIAKKIKNILCAFQSHIALPLAGLLLAALIGPKILRTIKIPFVSVFPKIQIHLTHIIICNRVGFFKEERRKYEKQYMFGSTACCLCIYVGIGSGIRT